MGGRLRLNRTRMIIAMLGLLSLFLASLSGGAAAGQSPNSGGLPALEQRVALLEASLSQVIDANGDLSERIDQLEAALAAETARAMEAEAALAESQTGEVWHGYYMQGGNQTGWLAYVTENGSTFEGWMTEWIGGAEYVSDISGSWSGGTIQFTKVYRTLHNLPIKYTGSAGAGGDITGTWTFSTGGGSGTWAMTR